MKLAHALIATALVGCGVDTAPGSAGDDGTGDPNPGDPGPGDPGDGTGPVTEVSGHITTNTTWKDVVHVVGSVIIDPGVTLTVAPATTIDVVTSKGYGITVSGVLDIQGGKDARVVIRSMTPGEFWSEIAVPRGGMMRASYLVQTGGVIAISSTGKVTLVDSQLSHAPGDLLVMSGGTLDMSYSAIGLEPGQRDSTHCDLHVSGPVTISVTHSSISTSVFGMMFYGGHGVVFTHNNWFGNETDIDTKSAYPVTGDFSDSYFAAGAPTNPGVTANNLSRTRLTDAGVR
jgi:hypothetical protein